MYRRHPRFRELFQPAESTIWWMFVPTESGRMLRESTGQRDDVAAHRKYLERVRAPRGEVSAKAKKERTLLEALDSRIEWLKAARAHDDPTRKKPAAATIEFYEKKSLPLIRLLGKDTLLSEIDHETIRKYIVERSKTAKAYTIRKELTTLSTAMKLARKDGVACERFDDIRPEDFDGQYVPRERWLSEVELDSLLEELAPKRAAVVAFIAATGATYPSEVAPVRPSHVSRYTVHLPGTKRKTRDRTFVVPSHGRKYFDRALPFLSANGFEPWSNIRGDLLEACARLSKCKPCREATRKWSRHVEGATKPPEKCKACERAKRFDPLCPTDLRRTFVQWLVRSGVPYELVYPMSGHDGPRMLETVYGKRDAIAVAPLVEAALKNAPKSARRKAS